MEYRKPRLKRRFRPVDNPTGPDHRYADEFLREEPDDPRIELGDEFPAAEHTPE